MDIKQLLDELDKSLSDSGFEPRDNIPAPVGSDERQKFCTAFDGFLPTQYLSFLDVQNGENFRASEFVFSEVSGGILSASGSMKTYLNRIAYASSIAGLDADNGSYVSKGPVFPFVWSRGWIPFLDLDSLWFLDMQPPPGGIVGQVCFQSAENQTVVVAARSLFELLVAQTKGVQNGVRGIEDVLDL